MNGWVKGILLTKCGLHFHLLAWRLATDRFLLFLAHSLSLPSQRLFLIFLYRELRAKIFTEANPLARIPHEQRKWPIDAADVRDRTNCQSRVFFSLSGIQKLNHICNGSFRKPHSCCISWYYEYSGCQKTK